jgi:hypothetical protein
METATTTMTMTFTYNDYTDEDYDNGILDYMNIPLDYYDEVEDPCSWYVASLFDLADEF